MVMSEEVCQGWWLTYKDVSKRPTLIKLNISFHGFKSLYLLIKLRTR